MDYTLQIHGEKRVYPVPNGLYELTSDIAREVLRNQPPNILGYISDYLQALVTTRNVTKDAVEIVDTTLSAGEKSIQLCMNLGLSLAEANKFATVIQGAWRGYKVRHSLGLSTTEEKGRERGESKPTSTDAYLEELKLTYLQATAAAVKIQPGADTLIAEGCPDKIMKQLPEWAYSWLHEFDKPIETDELMATPKDRVIPVDRPDLLYLPRRMICVDRHQLQTLIHGDREDYEALDLSDKSAHYPDLTDVPMFEPPDRKPCYKEQYGELEEYDMIIKEYSEEESGLVESPTSTGSSVDSGSMESPEPKDEGASADEPTKDSMTEPSSVDDVLGFKPEETVEPSVTFPLSLPAEGDYEENVDTAKVLENFLEEAFEETIMTEEPAPDDEEVLEEGEGEEEEELEKKEEQEEELDEQDE